MFFVPLPLLISAIQNWSSIMASTLKRTLLFKTVLSAALLNIGSAEAISIQDAVQASLNNHPQIEQAEARRNAAKQEMASARSGFFPGLSVGLTGGRMYGDNATARGTATTRGAAYSGVGEGTASLQQPIFDGFEALSRVRSTKAGVRSAGLQLQDVKEQIAYQTVEAYLNVMMARSVLRQIEAQKEKVSDYLKRIKENVDDGGSDEAQLQQAKDVEATLKGFVADYIGQLQAVESQYLELTGGMPGMDLEMPEIRPLAMPPTIEETIAMAQARHPAILSAREDSKSAAYDVMVEKSELYPELLGELSYLKSDKREALGGEVEDRRAVLRLNWEFETGGGQYARIKQRRYEQAEARAKEKEIFRQVERDIRIAYSEYNVAKERLNNQKDRVELNKKLFDTYETQFEGGLVSLLQLMQADNQLFNTKVEENVLLYRLLIARYGVIASLGLLQHDLFQTASVQELGPKLQKADMDEPKK
jgi:adhesin transport system outer membrane protein